MKAPTWRIRLQSALLLCLLTVTAGCSPLPQPAGNSSKNHYSPLSRLRMAPDIVALEIAVVTLDGEALEEFNRMWNKADLQSLPLHVRKRLDKNGFRTALLGSQLPGELTSALNWSQPLLTADGDILFNSRDPLPPNHAPGAYFIRQIEQLNTGDQHWIPCANPLAQVSWQINSGMTRRSGVCENAQCGWVISQVPVGDKTVKLWLRPVIRHGERKMRYGIDQDTLLVQEQQKKLPLDELDFAQRIRLGQTFVMTCHESPLGLGQQFYASGRFSSSRQVLLIRPVQMGQDDLFAPEKTSRRLSTNLD